MLNKNKRDHLSCTEVVVFYVWRVECCNSRLGVVARTIKRVIHLDLNVLLFLPNASQQLLFSKNGGDNLIQSKITVPYSISTL